MTFTSSDVRVSAAYARNGSGPMVYGRYRERGYAVNPLTAQVGTLVPENASPTEAFAIAGLNWTADKRPAYFAGADGPVRSPEHCAIVRSDTHELLGIQGAGYTPVQNSALVQVLQSLDGSIDLETVLSLRQGRRVFASASIRTEDEVVPGDRIRRYLHLFNSHDGSSAFGVFFSDVRLACANQLNYLTGTAQRRAVAKGQGLRARHTSSVERFAAELPQLIDLERRTFARTIDEMRALSRIRCTPEVARRVLEATFADKLAVPVKDRGSDAKRPRTIADLPEVDVIRSHYSGRTGMDIAENDAIRGTAYALYNAITQYYAHDAGRAKDTTERARARLESLYGGPAAQRIDRAREACLALV